MSNRIAKRATNATVNFTRGLINCFVKVYFFREGFRSWKATGYPIEVSGRHQRLPPSPTINVLYY